MKRITKGSVKKSISRMILKEEHTKVDKETGEITVIPSREDSYERLLEIEKQFSEDSESVEEIAVRTVMLERLKQALHTLTKEETKMGSKEKCVGIVSRADDFSGSSEDSQTAAGRELREEMESEPRYEKGCGRTFSRQDLLRKLR